MSSTLILREKAIGEETNAHVVGYARQTSPEFLQNNEMLGSVLFIFFLTDSSVVSYREFNS